MSKSMLAAIVAATTVVLTTTNPVHAKMMASTQYCLDEKYSVYGPKTAMQMCEIQPDEWEDAAAHISERTTADHNRGVNIGEFPPPSSYTARQAAYEAAQAEVDRRAEVRSHYPQPVEVRINRPMMPAVNPISPATPMQPSDKVARK